MKKKELAPFKPLFDLIPTILETTNRCVDQDLIEFDHDINRIQIEIETLKEILSIIQGKWTLDIMYCIRVLGESHYNDLKEVLSGISSRILSDRLKFLEKKKILERILHDTRPVGVSYKLTKYGERLFHLLVPVFIYAVSGGKLKI
ncbi:MAG: winged helix-turn-helix transcriptional regulator [Candidatus Hermodarchaeota archaeon]